MGATCARSVSDTVSHSNTAITLQDHNNIKNTTTINTTTTTNSKKNTNNNNNNYNYYNNKKNKSDYNNYNSSKSRGRVVSIHDKNGLHKCTPHNAHGPLEQEDVLSFPSVCGTPATSRREPSSPLLSILLKQQQQQRLLRNPEKQQKQQQLQLQLTIGEEGKTGIASPAMMSENGMTATFNRREWMQRRRSVNIATNKKKNNFTPVSSTTETRTISKANKPLVTKTPSKQFIEVGNEYPSSIVNNTSIFSSNRSASSSSSSAANTTTTTTENFTEFSVSVPLSTKTNGISMVSHPSSKCVPPAVKATEITTARRNNSTQHFSNFANTSEERKRGISSTGKLRGSGSEAALIPSKQKNSVVSRLLPPNLVPSPSEVKRMMETKNEKKKKKEEEKEEKRLPELTTEIKCDGEGDVQKDFPTELDNIRLFTMGDSNEEGTLHTVMSFRHQSSPDTLTSGEEVLALTSETIPIPQQLTSTQQRLQKKGVGNIFLIGSPLEIIVRKENEVENGLLDSLYTVNSNHFNAEEAEGGEGKKRNKEKKEENDMNSLNKSSSARSKKKEEKEKIDISLISQRAAIEEEEEEQEEARKRQKNNEIDISKTNNTPKRLGNTYCTPRSKSREGLVSFPPAIHAESSNMRSFSCHRSADESTNTSRNMEISSSCSHFTLNKKKHLGRYSNRLISPSPLLSLQPVLEPVSVMTTTRVKTPTRLTSPRTITGEKVNNWKNCSEQNCRPISPAPYQSTNLSLSHYRRIYSPAMESVSRTTTNTTGGSFALTATTTTTTTTTSSGDRLLGKKGGKYICQWCGGPYKQHDICSVKREPHATIREQRKHEKEVKKHAQSLLRNGRVKEAVMELREAGLV
ncbi:uncharacterized protein TM35_000122390 [Trypanosoma theileri]|uniref:Uncharacterized protein n=1 Tax=Trypanosoma theileri TaxID=67003 RepID=A0A1X0NXQ5_9TRYP|nr:uncharacterized protein TM35_000122390 [Trypanosoma theileri]ORC89464.1 hypothetical protein TM35_000122390 [Trypanosoma theileri]